MVYCKEIEDYYKYICDNPEEIDEEIKLLFKNIIIPTLQNGDVYFDAKQLEQCITYCEKWYYPLGIYQKAIYACVFMYDVEDHDIVKFSDVFILMARGNGKDGMIMPLANYMQTHYYGIKNYNIDIVATSEEAAINSFNVVYNMLENNKKVMIKYFYWNKQEIKNRKTGSILRYNTSNANTKYGKQSGMIIFNELHTYSDYKQLNTFSSTLGKIKHARSITITTDGIIRDGPLDEKKELSMQVLKGGPNHLRLLPFIFKADDEDDVHIPMKKFLQTNDKNDINIKRWCKANPSLNFMPTLKNQLIQDYLKMITQPSYKQEYYPQRMNLPKRNEEITVTSWENILKACYSNIADKIERPLPDLSGRTAVVGIDFASFQDFTSAGFLFKVDNEFIWRQKTWICSHSKFFNEIKFPFDLKGEKGFQDFEIVDNDFIDEKVVVDWIYEKMSEYNVVKIIMDSHRFVLLKNTFEKYGISAETRNNKDGIVRMIRLSNSIYNIIAPKIEKEFTEGNINLGDSAIMRWAINNTSMKQSKEGNITYEKIEPKLRKTDPFMAFVHAMSGHELLNEQVIYAY